MSDQVVELPDVGKAAKLLHGIETALIGEADVAELQRLLTRALPSFLDLFAFKVRKHLFIAYICSAAQNVVY